MRMMKTDTCINQQFCFLIFLHNENILQLRLVMKFLTMVSSSFLQQQIPVRKDTKLIMISFLKLFKPTCNTCETSWFLHSLETFSPDETLTVNQRVHPLLRASTIHKISKRQESTRIRESVVPHCSGNLLQCHYRLQCFQDLSPCFVKIHNARSQ